MTACLYIILIWCLALLFEPFLMGEFTGPVCECSKEYVPVECANGETYQNQCLAECAGAKECKLICNGKSHSLVSTLFR